MNSNPLTEEKTQTEGKHHPGGGLKLDDYRWRLNCIETEDSVHSIGLDVLLVDFQQCFQFVFLLSWSAEFSSRSRHGLLRFQCCGDDSSFSFLRGCLDRYRNQVTRPQIVCFDFEFMV